MDRSPTLASSSMSGLGRLGGPESLVCRRLTAFECAANTIDAFAIGVTAQSGGHIKGPYIDVVGCGEVLRDLLGELAVFLLPVRVVPAGAGRSASSLLLGGFCARGAGVVAMFADLADSVEAISVCGTTGFGTWVCSAAAGAHIKDSKVLRTRRTEPRCATTAASSLSGGCSWICRRAKSSWRRLVIAACRLARTRKWVPRRHDMHQQPTRAP